MAALENVTWFTIIALVLGWLSVILFRGGHFGVLGDLLVDAIGVGLGGWIFSRLGFASYGAAGGMFMALVGGLFLFALMRWIKAV